MRIKNDIAQIGLVNKFSLIYNKEKEKKLVKVVPAYVTLGNGILVTQELLFLKANENMKLTIIVSFEKLTGKRIFV